MRPIRWYDSWAGGDPGVHSQPRTLNDFQQERIQALPEELQEQARLVVTALEYGLATHGTRGEITGPHVFFDKENSLATVDLAFDIERPKFLPFEFHQYSFEVMLNGKACCLGSLPVAVTHCETFPAINELHESVHQMPFAALKTLTRQLMRNRNAMADFLEMADHFQVAKTEVYDLDQMVKSLGCHENLDEDMQEKIEKHRVAHNKEAEAIKKKRKDDVDSLNKALNNS